MLVVEIVVFLFPALCVLYNLYFCLAASLEKKKKVDDWSQEAYGRIAVLVPAYKEDAIILATVANYEKLRYPRSSFDIVVIADSLQPATLEALAVTSAIVVPVSFEKSTKVRALNAAFQQLDNSYDMALICDADNLLDADFLLKINYAFRQGHMAVQARRVAKNIDTPFAILDTANEIISNHLYRKGSCALGLSSSLIGSGMAFQYQLIKTAMQEIDATGGFDKVLQLLMADGTVFKKVGLKPQPIYYLEEALVFDEKVDNAAAFTNQRRRWLSSQYKYLFKYWHKGWYALKTGNMDYFNLFVCQNMMPPRMLLLTFVTLMPVLYFFLQHYLFIPYWYWLILWATNALTLLLPIPRLFYAKYFLKGLVSLPRAIGIMLALTFKLKGADNTFIHTSHSKTTVDNPLLDAE
ncbi:glycosyltransferase family 2 protein [Chitinophaga sp. Cy-1792]|uniref:glycosyltransferase n=1 Tax=Chitinophaga sp. Cy-1792 TaxID=2608339 RepID=UPI001421AD5F|nr:glycosyltransferase family 2 protein [Chitinophaga sp. Cy-1792]NIG56312.1 glycosyltransferase family 2 protein [Chitinophaga sp. Cy-1792]